jgi:hypothetical protein
MEKSMVGKSDRQEKFLRELLLDMERLFLAGDDRRGEGDWVAWFGGFLNKHRLGQRDFWRDRAEIDDFVAKLGSQGAWKLIGALVEARDRLDKGLPRERCATPGHLVRAISAAATRNGIDGDGLSEVIYSVTNGETTSRKLLRRLEAVEVLRRVGGETTVFEVVRGKGGKATTKERKVMGR